MTLAPLWAASSAIQLHAFAAMAAFVLGIIQFGAPKGTLPHRTLGWVWVLLMLGGQHQRILDPYDPAVGAVEPDPPVGDFHIDHAANRRAACPAS